MINQENLLNYLITHYYQCFHHIVFHDEINEVISLQTKLEALNQSFYNVEKDKVNKAKKEYDKNIKQIKKYYFTDTVDVDFVQLMNTYKGIKKLTKSFAKDYNNISSNLITMKKQKKILQKIWKRCLMGCFQNCV